MKDWKLSEAKRNHWRNIAEGPEDHCGRARGPRTEAGAENGERRCTRKMKTEGRQEAGQGRGEGKGGKYIEKIDGCFSNVMGLSLPWLRKSLIKEGFFP